MKRVLYALTVMTILAGCDTSQSEVEVTNVEVKPCGERPPAVECHGLAWDKISAAVANDAVNGPASDSLRP